MRARQIAAMEHYDVDALVEPVPSQTLGIHNRQFSVVANRDGKVAMLLTANELPGPEPEAPWRTSRPYDEFSGDPMATPADAIRDRGAADGRIGLEMDAIPASWWERLRPLLTDATWVNAAKAFEFASRVKSPASSTCSAPPPGPRTRLSSFGAHDMEPAIRFLGHGLGLSLHGEPFIASQTETELEVGMVFAIEPVYRSGASGSTWRTMSS
jgi:Xaa-Pro aminopeptidase